MVNNIVIDVTCKSSITACVMSYKGRVEKFEVFNSSYDNQYDNLLEGYIRCVKMLSQYLEKHTDFNGRVYFVTNNTVLVGWLKKNYTLPKYAEQFNTLTQILETIPVPVIYTRDANLMSEKYAKKVFVQRQYSGIDDFMS